MPFSQSTSRLGSRSRLAWIPAILLVLAVGNADAQQGSIEAGREKATDAGCTGCHGSDGNSVNPIWPSLAGQHAKYTIRQIEAYQAEPSLRSDPSMSSMVAMLTDEDSADIAAFYEAQMIAPKGADPSLVDRGERIYRGGIPERGIAACIACHGPSGRGNPPAGYPRVSHQHASYLATTLQAYRAGDRMSDAELNQMMRNVAELLLDDEIGALASYMQGLN